jgi:hypothetical protein
LLTPEELTFSVPKTLESLKEGELTYTEFDPAEAGGIQLELLLELVTLTVVFPLFEVSMLVVLILPVPKTALSL